jgi:hypothetical protein
MTGVLRLDAIPITGLPRMVKSDPVEPYSTKVNCVLHCERLPAHQHLEVSFNGLPQQSLSEGDQIIFSWQFEKASDEVRIKLFNRGIAIRHWQGCWNERDAILHLGTLPIQVFFDGKPQPNVPVVGGFTSAETLAAIQQAPEEVNGNGPPIALSTSDDKTHEPDLLVSEKQTASGVVVVQDLLVIAEPRPSSSEQFADGSRREDEPEEVSQDEPNEVKKDEFEEDDEMDEKGKDGFDEMEEGEPGEVSEDGFDEVGEDEPEEVKEDKLDEVRSFGESEPFVVQEDLQVVESGPTTGPRIAAFHASPLAYEKTLAALKELMALMPPKTIIVDLRRHSRTKKRSQGQSELSKDRLRATFGGKYWDRGWAIETTYQRASASEEHFSPWRQVLVDPDRSPDGIPSFVKHLQEGYSLVMIDNLAAYAESPRRAVIEELQKRISNLAVGPLG